MDSALTTVGLPAALAIVMFGLGLDLTLEDFRRVARTPRAAAIALACQIVLLPVVCFALVKAFGLSPVLAVGFLILAASPGGTTANLLSHLFRGDVALNISLTAINSVLSLATLPLITNFALQHFGLGDTVKMPFDEVVKVFAIILVPVAIGMVVRRLAPGFAEAMERPVRILSAIILAVLVVAIMIDQRDILGQAFRDAGVVAAIFCSISLLAGYYIPRALGIRAEQAIASSMEVGVHNSVLAIVIAVEVLESVAMSVPAAIYSLLMYPLAVLWGKYTSDRLRAAELTGVLEARRLRRERHGLR